MPADPDTATVSLHRRLPGYEAEVSGDYNEALEPAANRSPGSTDGESRSFGFAVILSIEDFLDAQPRQVREQQQSGELRAAFSVLTLAAAQLEWSDALDRAVAYLPDSLLLENFGRSIETIRSYYGASVMVLPSSVRVP